MKHENIKIMSEEKEESPEITETVPESEPVSEPQAVPEAESTPEPVTEKPILSEPTTVPAATFNEREILSEQFENYLRIAQALMKTLKRPKDIEICTDLLRKVQRHNDSKHLEVKRNNNAFFRYCLKVLKWTSDNQPERLYQCWYKCEDTPESIAEARTWLEDNKSYVALKVLKDGASLIYAAIAADPSSGWQDGGLNILAKRGVCDRL